jgi:hypothetical protein
VDAQSEEVFGYNNKQQRELYLLLSYQSKFAMGIAKFLNKLNANFLRN